jgi:hypothetical protein
MVDEMEPSDPCNLHKYEKKHGALCNKFWETREQYKVAKEGGGVIVRSAINDDRMVLLVEKRCEDMHPNDFLVFIRNYAYYTKKYDKEVKEIIHLGADVGAAYEAFKITTNMPAIFTPRYMFMTSYPFIDYAKDEHMWAGSCEGLEPVIEQNLKPEEKKHIHMRMNHCGYKFMPIRDDKGKVIATNFFISSDIQAGGKAMDLMAEFLGPMAINE